MSLKRTALQFIFISVSIIADITGKDECPSRQYLERGTMGSINCAFPEDVCAILWYNTTHFTQFESIISYVESAKSGSGFLSGEYDIHANGSLVIRNVSLQHETVFTVAILDTCVGENPRYITIRVIITVTPETLYPVVDGCGYQTLCVLQVLEGNKLTCTVAQVRPQIFLEWKQLNGSSSVTLYDQKYTADVDGDTFNVTVTSVYRVMGPSMETVAVACNSFHEKITRFNRSTLVVLNIIEDQPTNAFQDTRNPQQLMVIILCVLLFILFGVIICIVYYKRRESKRKKDLQKEDTRVSVKIDIEDVEMKERTKEEEKPLLRNKDDIKNELTRQLKETYKDYVNDVKPIPYKTHRKFHVNDVFVECQVKFLPSNQDIPEDYDSTGNAMSYRDIFNHSPDKPDRIILEADPGHGKSTLTLQFVNEWCNSTSGSFFKTVDILILLKLREIRENLSIFAAIRKYILPDDTTLSENDIANSIEQSSNVVIILEGFDEFLDKENDNDIMKMINRKILQNTLVVLTTRSSSLPKTYAPSTKRFKLIGFDDKAQSAYIARVCEGNKKYAKKINDTLYKNPVMKELCKIPLFLAMFVHMSHDDKGTENIQSFTSSVSYVIACFHSHMRNKSSSKDKMRQFEREHASVDKVAFFGLRESEQSTFWGKDKVITEIGEDVYNHFTCTGIFVESDVLDTSANQNLHPIQYKAQVRFLHKIFREWYAAHHVINCIATQDSAQRTQYLEKLNPFVFPSLYLFSCGLNPEGCGFIINYLESHDSYHAFTNVCILEQVTSGSSKQKLKERSPLEVNMNLSEIFLIQCSSLRLLELASKYKIPIEHVKIDGGIFPSAVSSDRLVLTSELSIPPLITMKKLSMNFNNQDISKERIEAFLHYFSLCSQLKQLELQHILMPKQLQWSALPHLRSKQIEVTWYPGSGAVYNLDLEDGVWKNTGSGDQEINDEMYEREKTYIEEKRKERARQRWTKARNVILFTS